jgi:hypothetical protein
MSPYENDIEKIKRALRSSHAVRFNLNTVDIDLDEEYIPVVRKREPKFLEQPSEENESSRSRDSF